MPQTFMGFPVAPTRCYKFDRIKWYSPISLMRWHNIYYKWSNINLLKENVTINLLNSEHVWNNFWAKILINDTTIKTCSLNQVSGCFIEISSYLFTLIKFHLQSNLNEMVAPHNNLQQSLAFPYLCSFEKFIEVLDLQRTSILVSSYIHLRTCFIQFLRLLT